MTPEDRDLDRKYVTKNAWRVTRDRDKTCLRIRVPGGHLDAEYLSLVRKIADEYGNGTVHLTVRQGFEIPGIPWEKRREVNALVRPMIEWLGLAKGATDDGYPAAGTRNVSACIGNRVCPFANDDTTRIAQRIEREIYPHDFHFKVAVTGCPNDCVKAHMQDFGIICTTIPQYDENRCISCSACVDNCKKRVTNALRLNGDFNVERDDSACIGCGECVKVCPTRAMTRSATPFYRMVIMGRTGKKNPRLAMTFIERGSEDLMIAVIKNTYAYVDRYIDRGLVKEHIGYIVDRTGFETFRKEVLECAPINPEAIIAEKIEWPGYRYKEGKNA